MFLSQTKAGELAGVSRGTIANRIKSGRLSETPEGIDVADLVRVFPTITPDDIAAINDPDNRREKASNKLANPVDDMTKTEKLLLQQLTFTQERLEKADQRLSEREDWYTEQLKMHREELQILKLLAGPKKGWWQKLAELVSMKTESAKVSN